jgi:hypothetical protein
MKNRMSTAPRPAFSDQRPPTAGTSHTMSVDPVGDSPDTVGLCETWRAWAAGTNSEFLNWFLFTRHGRSSAVGAPVLEDWICFKDGSSELDDRTRVILGERVKLLGANPAMRIVIGGLAGKLGTIEHDMRLGLRRVLSIRMFLLAHGIDPGRIGIAVRGPGWSVAERAGGSEDPTGLGSECRLQVTDPLWTLARN